MKLQKYLLPETCLLILSFVRIQFFRNSAEDVISAATDGLTVCGHSHIKDLREACRWLGKSQSGSTERMFRRIKEAHLEAQRREDVFLSEEQY